MQFILDVSVAVSWCFEDESNDYADSILKDISTKTEILVPELFFLEIANVLVIAERRKRIERKDITGISQFLHSLPIRTANNISFGEIIKFARKYQLTSYDATYLALAHHNKLNLATLDNALQRALEDSKINSKLLVI